VAADDDAGCVDEESIEVALRGILERDDIP
jgi:hypothetical protein